VPPESLVPVDDYVKNLVDPKIEELAHELVEKFQDNHDDVRVNELNTELKRSLRVLADKVDRGLNVELRVAALDSTQNEEQITDEKLNLAIDQIRKSSQSVKQFDNSGDPILFLSEEVEEDQ